MNLTGSINGVVPGFGLNNWSLILNINEDGLLRDGYDRLKDKKLSIKITESKRKRSLDANAYYWELMGKLSHALKRSQASLHNEMLRRIGIKDLSFGEVSVVYIPDTEKAAKQVDENTVFHLMPTSNTKNSKNGMIYRAYILLKGSSKMNTVEFNDLLNELIADCKDQGIETATPDELEKMKNLYEKRLRNEQVDNAGP